MPEVRHAYTPAPVGTIGKVLTEVFSSLEGDRQTVVRAAGANFMVAAAGPASLSSLEGILEELAVIHPSRFFVVCLDVEAETISAGVSARCHIFSKGRHVCSEVIRLVAPPDRVDALPGILRANFLPGLPTELFVAESDVSPALLEHLSRLADVAVLDAAHFDGRPDLLRGIAGQTGSIIDLQWIGLGPWRDQIRSVFDRSADPALLATLRSIEIEVSGSDGVSLAGLLLAGWLSERLGLASIRGAGGAWEGTLSMPPHPPRPVGITVSARRGAEGAEPRIEAVCLRFQGAEEPRVVLSRRGSELECTVHLGSTVRMSRPLEGDEAAVRLRRYFLIGESTTNYPAALRAALALAIAPN